MTTGLVAAALFGALGWTLSGPGSLPWAMLAGLLVARIENTER
jgi:hypothetical protein